MSGERVATQPFYSGIGGRSGSDLVYDRSGNAKVGLEGFDEVKLVDFAEENDRRCIEDPTFHKRLSAISSSRSSGLSWRNETA